MTLLNDATAVSNGIPAIVFKSAKWLTPVGIIVTISMLILGSFVLILARDDAWMQARRDLENLSITLEREISRNIAVYALSLEGTQKALTLPGLTQVSPEIRHATLFDQAASAEYLGAIVILDKDGWDVEDSTSSTPNRLSMADRDYFTVHRDKTNVGLYVSQPFRSRLRGNDPSISLSRRMDNADGQFNGVVVGAMRLAYFNSLFDQLNLGAGGAIILARTDGRLIARRPQRDGDLDQVLGASSQMWEFLHTGRREMIGRSAIDGVERLFVFRQIVGVPLVLGIAMSTETVMAPWWHRSIAIGLALAILSAAVAALCWLFARELRSRIRAEAKAVEFGEQVLVLATTDPLTGLANRRAFNERLDLEWRRSTRNKTSLGLLVIDADLFKLFNDRYGHLEGDHVLQVIAECMLRCARRPGDLCARFGGEEFVILLPETELEGARLCAEAIRADVLALDVPHGDSLLGFVSVSIGVAALYPYVDEASSYLIKQADNALYEAKRTGRNKVMAGSLEEAKFDREVTEPK